MSTASESGASTGSVPRRADASSADPGSGACPSSCSSDQPDQRPPDLVRSKISIPGRAESASHVTAATLNGSVSISSVAKESARTPSSVVLRPWLANAPRPSSIFWTDDFTGAAFAAPAVTGCAVATASDGAEPTSVANPTASVVSSAWAPLPRETLRFESGSTVKSPRYSWD
ncbi:MAG: hypothetical protein GEU96_15530 [Propionibacteriales bacterium]|nr:hypothetical protein [Propionibacteriales bacterium]